MVAFHSSKQIKLLATALALTCATACSANKSEPKAGADVDPARSKETHPLVRQNEKKNLSEPASTQAEARHLREAIKEAVFVAQKHCAAGTKIKVFRSSESNVIRYLSFVDLDSLEGHDSNIHKMMGARLIVTTGPEAQVSDESFDYVEFSEGPWESLDQAKVTPIGPAAKVVELRLEGGETPKLVLAHTDKVRQSLSQSSTLHFELTELSAESPIRARLCDRVARFGSFGNRLADSALFGFSASLLKEKVPLVIQFVNLLVARNVTLISPLTHSEFTADLYLQLNPDSTYELGTKPVSDGEASATRPKIEKRVGRFEVSGERLKLLGPVEISFTPLGKDAATVASLELKLDGSDAFATLKEPVVFEFKAQAFARRSNEATR